MSQSTSIRGFTPKVPCNSTRTSPICSIHSVPGGFSTSSGYLPSNRAAHDWAASVASTVLHAVGPALTRAPGPTSAAERSRIRTTSRCRSSSIVARMGVANTGVASRARRCLTSAWYHCWWSKDTLPLVSPSSSTQRVTQ